MASKIWDKWTYLWNANRFTDTENRLVVTKREEVGGGVEWETKRKWSRSVVSDSLQPQDCSLPDSSIHGIFQARVLEWVAISSSRGSSQSSDWIQSLTLQADALSSEPPGKPREWEIGVSKCKLLYIGWKNNKVHRELHSESYDKP